ncbi:Guanosine-3',5'-bis(diphosphate) 3'-pyrophosphohydrolase MESH1, variant 2 [Entomophthora muscae]|uniref:Guanosine-3',5'-bis(Diphosphate) 3'-pyrophosphohydrolase MESH1, variant 2 n=1 Tax=Entomophthora muscae TaxID=34485 RepID=A0ACC2RGP9_9FUNG|nr:Guanosine-3',5'-bis(diphosphate) 3'-pyrophosphohydrolase MESH1, variant 2 [Entomophthora muscae]
MPSNNANLDMNELSHADYSAQDLKHLFKALSFACLKHSNQRRKDPQRTPYINHPIGVANFLIKSGVIDLITIQAALLHDTLEDTDTLFEELETTFGRAVATTVKEVSDDPHLPKAERKKLQIQNALFLSHRAKQVRLADKLYNLTDIMLQTPEGWTLDRVQEYFIWARNVTSSKTNGS